MNGEGVKNLLAKLRIPHSCEAEMQEFIERAFLHYGVSFVREASLAAADRVDFLVSGGIAVECKVKGQPLEILRQLERYARSQRVSVVVLVTSRHMRLPTTIEGKPAFVVNVSLGWL